jgi:hypothetical protein
MKLLSLLLLPTASAFHLSMSGNRSPLSQQYKSITSIHNSMLSGSSAIVGSGVRMAPPPGEPEPEVSFSFFVFLHVVHFCREGGMRGSC